MKWLLDDDGWFPIALIFIGLVFGICAIMVAYR